MTDKLLDRILTGLSDLSRAVELLEKISAQLEQQNQPATPKSYLDPNAADNGVDEWLQGHRS
jgi:hypothetical protein